MNAHWTLALTWAVIAAFQVEAQAPQPMARYTFNGNPLDISGNGYTGVVHAASVAAAYGSGYYGGDDLALHLTNDAYFDMATLAVPFRDHLHALTIALYLRVDGPLDAPVPDQVLLSLGGGGEGVGTNEFGLHFRDGRLEVVTETADPGPDHMVMLDDALRCGRWYFLTLVVDQAQLTYYRNIQQVRQATYVPAETTTDELYLGGFAANDTVNGCCFFTGSIDDLRVFDEALSMQQVAALDPSHVGVDETAGRITAMGPNPADDELRIDLDRSGMALDLLGLDGRVVEHLEQVPDHLRLDTSRLPAGCYMLRLTSPLGSYGQRVVVRH